MFKARDIPKRFLGTLTGTSIVRISEVKPSETVEYTEVLLLALNTTVWGIVLVDKSRKDSGGVRIVDSLVGSTPEGKWLSDSIFPSFVRILKLRVAMVEFCSAV
jgi:hypothetical protein